MVRLFFLATAVALAVGPGHCWSATLKVPEDHPTIAEALEEAAPDDRILVGPGRYEENLLITKPVQLISERKGGAEIVGRELAKHVVEFRAVEGAATIQGFKIDGLNRSGNGILVERSSVRILGNEIIRTSLAIEFRSAGGEVAENVFRGNPGGEIMLRGSSPPVVRNRFEGVAAVAMSIIGKKSQPVIGGSPGQGNVFGPGYDQLISNETKNDINAKYNEWNWSATVEMNAEPYPTNITAIRDRHDEVRLGSVDYRNWAGGGSSLGRTRLGAAVLLVVVAVVVVLVLALRRRKASA